MRNWTRTILTAGSLVLLLTACSGSTPDIHVSEAEVDLGEVINGEIKTIEIPIFNYGTADLVIEAVTTSCGCTTASVEPSTIQPGGSGALSVQFDSGAHGPDDIGPMIRQVFIASNDPDESEVEFRFLADVLSSGS